MREVLVVTIRTLVFLPPAYLTGFAGRSAEARDGEAELTLVSRRIVAFPMPGNGPIGNHADVVAAASNDAAASRNHAY